MQSPEPLKRLCPMDERERFVKFYDAIPDLMRSYVANFVWTVGLLTFANGWLISSASGRTFIRDSVFAYVGAMVVTITIGLLHTAVCWGYHLRSKARIAQLTTEYDELSPLPFRDYEITRPILLVNLLVSWSAIASLLIILTAAHRMP